MKLLKTIPENKKPEFLSDFFRFYEYHKVISTYCILFIFMGAILFYLYQSMPSFIIGSASILTGVFLFVLNLVLLLDLKKKWSVYKHKR